MDDHKDHLVEVREKFKSSHMADGKARALAVSTDIRKKSLLRKFSAEANSFIEESIKTEQSLIILSKGFELKDFKVYKPLY